MNFKRVIAFGAAAGGLAALVAGAATSGNRPVERPVLPRTTEVDASGAQLSAEIARLHERLRPTIAPQARARNLFAFTARPPREAVAPLAPALSEASPATVDPMRSVKLIGVAEDSGPDGELQRTAIISGFGELFFAKEGETVADRFRVSKISSDVVELTDIQDNTRVALALK
jgi:hypothetical protein